MVFIIQIAIGIEEHKKVRLTQDPTAKKLPIEAAATGIDRPK